MSVRRKVFWVMPSELGNAYGVYLYNKELASIFKKFYDVRLVASRDVGRSVLRYFSQFLVLPLRIFFLTRRDDVVVLPQESYGFLLPILRVLGRRSIIVVHHATVTLGKAREDLVSRLKSAYLRSLQGILSSAWRIFVPSRTTASDLIAVDARLEPIYLPNVVDVFHSASQEVDAGLGKRFILVVSSNEPRKNLEVLLAAVGESSFDGVVIRVGRNVVELTSTYNELVARLGSRFCALEGLSPAQLKWLYENAICLISPSLHEGFGRPVVEAQAYGLPVMCSNIPVYREITGGLAILVSHPSEVESWRVALDQFIGNDGILKELGKKARANAEKFSSARIGQMVRNLDLD